MAAALGAGDMQRDVVLGQELGEVGDGVRSVKKASSSLEAAQPDHGVAPELAVVGDQEDLARVGR